MKVCLKKVNAYSLRKIASTALTMAGVGLALLSTAAADDVVIDSGLTGSIVQDGWFSLSASEYPGIAYGISYPGTAAWTSAMVANETGSAGGEFFKTSGAGYAASQSVYSPTSGSFSVSNDTVVDDIETVVFSMNVGAPSVENLILNINGADSGLVAAAWNLGSRSVTIDTAGGAFTTDIVTLAYQWDLSSIATPITSFDVNFDSVADSHTQLYQLQLEQSDSFSTINPVAVSAVPEPSGISLCGAICGLLAFRRRRTA